MINCPNFSKTFNDRFGHPAGDKLLVDLSQAVGRVVRKVDIFCRLGGEEFALILPETGQEGAMFVAEKVRETIESTKFYGNDNFPVIHKTVSLGVAIYPLDAASEAELIAEADKMLYKAKSEGKNKVATAE